MGGIFSQDDFKKKQFILNKIDYSEKKIFHKIKLYPDSMTEAILPIIKKNQNNSISYVDLQFPADIESLTESSLRFKNGVCMNYVWKKPNEFLDDPDFQLFHNKIEPDDVKQGQLGDCYFLSALSVLSEKPYCITQLFENENVNQFGMYAVWLCINGQWKQIIVDHRIPCNQNGKDLGKISPVFSQGQQGELWVMIIEKAYAKAYKTYENIENGLSSDALRDLTGAPCEINLDLKDDRTFEYIENSMGNGYFVTASTEDNNDLINKKGIINKHCYAILDCRKVQDKDQQVRLVQLRNPWAHLEWNGDWSDNSDKWTDDLKKQLKFEKKDDGKFWMSWQDFGAFYHQICTCKVNESFKYSSILCEIPNSQDHAIITFSVQTRLTTYLQVNQKDLRFTQFDQTLNKGYNFVRMSLFKIDPLDLNVMIHIKDQYDCQRNVTLEVNLDEGDYLLFVQIDWQKKQDNSFVLSAYGNQLIDFDPIQESKQDLNLLNKMLEFHSLKNSKIFEYLEDSNIKRYIGLMCGYVYVIYKNDSEKASLKEDLNFENVMFLRPYNNTVEAIESEKQIQLTVFLKPGNSLIVKLKSESKGLGEIVYDLNTKYLIQILQDQKYLQEQVTNQPNGTVQRKVKGLLIDVFVSHYSYAQGVMIRYHNKTKHLYNEKLNLILKNLNVSNLNANDININIEPQKDFYVQLNTIDGSFPFSYQMKYSCQLLEFNV